MRTLLKLDGTPTNTGDPDRGVWYSPKCGYWTDDWSKLRRFGPGIPCCPHCHAPGMQTTAGDWESGAEKHDKDHPGYLKELAAKREACSNQPRQTMVSALPPDSAMLLAAASILGIVGAKPPSR